MVQLCTQDYEHITGHAVHNEEALTLNAPSPAAEFWTARGMRYCSRTGGGLMGAGGAAVTVLGVSVPRDRLIIPSVAALSAPANIQSLSPSISK